MIILAILALLCLAFAGTLAVRAVAMTRTRTIRNLDTIALHGYAPPVADGDDRQRAAIDRLAGALGGAASRRLSMFREEELNRRLIAAGLYNVGARRLFGYQLLLVVAVPLLLIWLMALAGAPTGLVFLFAVAGAIFGWIGPLYYVGRRERSRLAEIEYGLPEMIDLLVVTIEGGLSFTASLRMASERMTGPIGDELRLTLQEQALGLTTLEALDHWLARCETPSLRSFVRAMTQGERLGVSIGQILRNLALEMRKRRRASAEERAQRAPIKIMFPLVFLIFPAMFVVVLGPAFYGIIDALTSK